VSDILVIAEVRRGEVREVTAEAVTAALGLGADRVVVGAFGGDGAGLSYEGVDEVVVVERDGEGFDGSLMQATAEALIADVQPAVVLCGQSADAQGFAAAVAARGGYGFASDVTHVGWDSGELVARRGAYAGKFEAELDFPAKATTILLTRVGAFDAAPIGDAVAVRRLDAELPAPASRHLDYVESKPADGVDITKADFLVSIGRGVKSQAQADQIGELAERIGAELSASRPVIDAGWVPRFRGVGQSGRKVTPSIYLALGISGAAQHLAGIRGAGTIIAVNTDEDAPIFEVADYGAVCDLAEVTEALERLSAGG
jgi:electron transfer flavoprotein alpha subunit